MAVVQSQLEGLIVDRPRRQIIRSHPDPQRRPSCTSWLNGPARSAASTPRRSTWSVFGDLAIRRASHVEPDAAGRWWADLAPVGGPRLGPFDRRSEALAAELRWLERHWCGPLGTPRALTDGADKRSLCTTAPPEDRPWE